VVANVVSEEIVKVGITAIECQRELLLSKWLKGETLIQYSIPLLSQHFYESFFGLVRF